MKQKNCNIIMSICNIIGIIGLLIITIPYNEGFNTIITSDIKVAITDHLIYRYFTCFIILVIANFICSIQNRKNKKLMIWYGINSILYMMLAILLDMEEIISNIFRETSIENDEIISMGIGVTVLALLAVIMIIAIIDIIKIIKNKEHKGKILAYVGLIIGLAIFYYFSKGRITYLTLMFSTIMQIIDNKYYGKEERIIKRLVNAAIYTITTISIIILIASAFYIYIYAKNIDEQMLKLVNEIKENLRQVKNNERIIGVYDGTGFGTINLKGKEVIPCGKYDSIEYIDGCGIQLATKDGVYTYLGKDGTELATCDKAPTPWLADFKLRKTYGHYYWNWKDVRNWLQKEGITHEDTEENILEPMYENYNKGRSIDRSL